MSTTRLPELPADQRFKWDQEQDDTFGFMVGPVPDGEWMRVSDLHAYGLAVWKAAMDHAMAQLAAASVDGCFADAENLLAALPLPEQGGQK